MKIKSLVTASIINSMIVYSAFASLPDEINYAPYKVEYGQLSAQADVVLQSLESVKDQLNDAYTDETSIELTIENLEERSDELISEIDDLEEQRTSLDERSSDLEFKVTQLVSKLEGLERKKKQINRQIDQENIRLNPLRQKVSKVKGLVSSKRDEKVAAKKSHDSKLSASTRLTREFNSLKSQENKLQEKLNNLITSLTNVQKNITNTKSAIKAINPQIDSAKVNVEGQRSKKQSLSKVVKKYKSERDTLVQTDASNPRIAELDVLIKHSKQAVVDQVVILKSARAKLKNLKQKRDTLNGELASFEAQQVSLPNDIASTQSSLQSASAASDAKQSQMAVAVNATKVAKVQLDKATAELKRLSSRLELFTAQLNKESIHLNELKEERQRFSKRVVEVSKRLRNRRQDLNSVNSDLASVEREIPVARRELRGTYSEIDGLENDLSVTRTQIVSLNQNVNRISSELRVAQSRRDSKYQEYLSRLNYYGEKMDEAKSIGHEQTYDAPEIATTDSNEYTVMRSNELGTEVGTNLSNAQANLYASVRSEIKGYNDGYEQGHASDVDQQRGQVEGSAAGKREAQDFAREVLKPQYFNNIFASKIEQAELKVNAFQKLNIGESKANHEELKSLFDSSSSVGPLSQSEINTSLELTTGLDTSIETYKRNYKQIQNKFQSLSEAQNVYEDVAVIPYQEFSCSSVYKNVSDFIKACEESYHSSFKSQYEETHYSNFSMQYKASYSQKVESTRNDLIDQMYSDAYASFYPIAKDSGVADGKKAIYAETFSTARATSYEMELPSADQNALNTAKVEVTNWINDNATLTLKGSSVQSSTFRAGDIANVDLSVKNLSPKDLTSPVRVIITSAKNAVLSQREFSLKSAAGFRTSLFKDVKFQIHPDAKSNDQIEVKGRVILSGGKYNAQRVETFSASALASLNPSVNSELKYLKFPKVLTTFRRRIIIHKLEATLSPRIESVKSGYSVSIKALPGSEEYIKFKNTKGSTNTLRFGESSKLKFKYTFRKKSRGKTIKVQMDYTYKGRVVKSEVIVLKPN